MEVKIDQAGRIVLPKPTRDRLHLRSGSRLELEERPDGIVLRPIDPQTALKKEHGFWVHQGVPTRAVNWDRLVDEDREDRIQELLRR